jgi:hypothetical protein
MVGDVVSCRVQRKRSFPRDSTGTYSTEEDQSPLAKSTNTVSPAPPTAAPPSTVPTSQQVTHSNAPQVACSQAACPPNTTSEALLTLQDLARSDEPHAHQHQAGT